MTATTKKDQGNEPAWYTRLKRSKGFVCFKEWPFEPTEEERREAWSMEQSDTTGRWLAYDWDNILIGEFASEEAAENAKR